MNTLDTVKFNDPLSKISNISDGVIEYVGNDYKNTVFESLAKIENVEKVFIRGHSGNAITIILFVRISDSGRPIYVSQDFMGNMISKANTEYVAKKFIVDEFIRAIEVEGKKLSISDERPIIKPKTPWPSTIEDAESLPEYLMFGSVDFGGIKFPTIKNDLVISDYGENGIISFGDKQGDTYRVVLDRDGKYWKMRAS